jgi:hypothetical protein
MCASACCTCVRAAPVCVLHLCACVARASAILVTCHRGDDESSFELFRAFADGTTALIVAGCVLGGTAVVLAAIGWLASLEMCDAASLVSHLSGRTVMGAVALAATLNPVRDVRLAAVMPTVVLGIGHTALCLLAAVVARCRSSPPVPLSAFSPLLTRGEATVSPLFSVLRAGGAGASGGDGAQDADMDAEAGAGAGAGTGTGAGTVVPVAGPASAAASAQRQALATLAAATSVGSSVSAPALPPHQRGAYTGASAPMPAPAPTPAPTPTPAHAHAHAHAHAPATVAAPTPGRDPAPVPQSAPLLSSKPPSVDTAALAAPRTGASQVPSGRPSGGSGATVGRATAAAASSDGGGGDGDDDDDDRGGDSGDSEPELARGRAGANASASANGKPGAGAAKAAAGAGAGAGEEEVAAPPAHFESALETARRLARGSGAGGDGPGGGRPISTSEKDRLFFAELKRSKEDAERAAEEQRLAAMNPEELAAYQA